MTISSIRSRAVLRAGPRPATRRTRLVPRFVGYVYLLPALVVYVLFLLAPFGHSVYLSFYSWDGISPHRYVGWANYKDALGSGEIRGAFVHAFVLIGFYAVLTTAVALVLVLLGAITIVVLSSRGTS